MKKLVGIVMTLLLIVYLFMSSGFVSAASLSDSIVLQLTETHTESQIDINVRLVTNTGISSMTLELVYDKEVFEYKGYEEGNALADMDLMVTDLSVNPDLPVKFNWFNQNVVNVFTTGNILKLHFNLKPNCPSGDYKIGFKYGSGDIVYIENNNPATKSALISQAVIVVSKNKITKTEIIESEDDNNNLGLVIAIVAAASVCVITVTTLVIVNSIRKKRKKKNWIKI